MGHYDDLQEKLTSKEVGGRGMAYSESCPGGVKSHDPVNHPKHYTNSQSGVECIEVTEHLNFCIGNAIKYLWRSGDPNELGGSAWVAAGTSMILFALGALVPLVPFLVSGGQPALVVAAALSGSALFALGAGITRLTGMHPIRSGLRQLAFGATAATITYGIGVAVGTALR